MISAFCIIFRKSPDCSVATFWLFTLREAGAVVLVQSVSGSTETYVRTIWKLSAKMLATPVSVAATVGGQTYCEGADRVITTKRFLYSFCFDDSARDVNTPLSQLCPWKPFAHLQA